MIAASRSAERVAVTASLNGARLAMAPLRYADGRNDNYMQTPAEIRHLRAKERLLEDTALFRCPWLT